MPGDIRAPRLRVTLDGVELPGAVGAEVHSNNHFAADRFRVRLAAAAQAGLHTPDRRVEIIVGLDGVWSSLIVGRADSVCLDPVRGTIELEGRDLSSMLVESQIDETFANRTASEIAQVLSSRHGLQALVDRTSTPVGRFYQSEHDRITLGQFAKTTTEWDLLAQLATREGFDLYMIGDALRFGTSSDATGVTLHLRDCISMQLDHCVSLGRAMEVSVRSWGSKAGSSVTGAARTSGPGVVARRTITRPNLTSEEANRLAQQTIADLKRHEWAANITMPGELDLSPRSKVALTGTATAWDRTYSVSQISRHLDLRNGFTQRVTLQGQS